MGGAAYQYDGLGNRIQQKTGDLATRYLLDLQPGLAVILRTQGWDETDPGDPLLTDTTSYVHSQRGIHAQETMSGWEWMVQDGLGSVRGVVDNTVGVLESRNYDPYGESFGATGSSQTAYGFTGEPTDSNGLLHLRARYYSPAAGVFTALDPFEGMWDEPMSINGYSYVHGNPVNGAVGELLGLINGYSYANGNPVNLVDPSGMCAQPTQWGNPIDVNCYYSADGLARRFSNGDPNLYQVYFDVLIQKTWEELKIIEATGTFADITGGAQQFLDNAQILTDLFVQNPQLLLQALNQYLFGCGSSNVALGTAAPAFGRSPQVFFVVVGGIAVAATFLGAYTLLKQLTQSPTVGNTQSYEFRLSGFDRKVGLIAAHLAKVLGYEVAGYPPSGPNPGDRATRGWCVEIRNFIQQIDNAGYTERQLNRDLEAAGISTEVWNTIKAAVRAVAEKCNDHWDDFTGGSLATG